MSARPDTFMAMYWGDYVRDTGNLNALAHGAYLMLIKHYWCTGAPLADDDDELWRVACCDSKRQWMSIRAKIVRLFKPLADGRLSHKRVEQELTTAVVLTEQRSKAGKASAEARRRQREADENSTGHERDDGERSTPVDIPLQQNARPSPSPSPSPSPERKKDIATLIVQLPLDGVDKFDEFWKLYPRKEAKLDARKAWTAAIKLATPDQIIEGLRRYAFNPDPHLQKLPAGWLRDGRFLGQGTTAPLTVARRPDDNRHGAERMIEDYALDVVTPMEKQNHAQRRNENRDDLAGETGAYDGECFDLENADWH